MLVTLIILLWLISIPITYFLIKKDTKKYTKWTKGERAFSIMISIISGPIGTFFYILYLFIFLDFWSEDSSW